MYGAKDAGLRVVDAIRKPVENKLEELRRNEAHALILATCEYIFLNLNNISNHRIIIEYGAAGQAHPIVKILELKVGEDDLIQNAMIMQSYIINIMKLSEGETVPAVPSCKEHRARTLHRVFTCSNTDYFVSCLMLPHCLTRSFES